VVLWFFNVIFVRAGSPCGTAWRPTAIWINDTRVRALIFILRQRGQLFDPDGNGITATGIPFTTAGFQCEFTPQAGNLYRFCYPQCD